MNEENLADILDGILAVRLREVPRLHPSGPLNALGRMLHGIRGVLAGKPNEQPSTPGRPEVIARIRSLPDDLQNPLRRYFVFREAEESICVSINVTPADFRRFVQDAADYILMRSERMPVLEAK